MNGSGTITFNLILGGTRQTKTGIGAGTTTATNADTVTLK
jgi:hypothetical protein